MSNQALTKHQAIAKATPITKEVSIYHIKGKKVGSSSDLSNRLARQGSTVDSPEVEILCTMPASPKNILWDVWLFEQVEALKRGYKMEHAGNLATFIYAHTNTPETLMYSLTDLEGNHFEDIGHAKEWEDANGILIGSLSRICNPSLRHKYITLPSGKYTVSYQTAEGGSA
jgi:hypothetical protein|tara:strand:- start:313 stop:825 length:513 start_codon:yes stop_codon:yes gene_type:complete